MAERTIVLDGLSKTYAMCGWRLGYGVMPRALGQRMETLLINTSSCAAAFTQLAALEALESPTSEQAVAKMVIEFKQRRDGLVAGLTSIPGVRCSLPEASFYAFPNITGTGMSSREMASRLLQEAGVAVLAGEAFGDGGQGFIRLAHTRGLPDIAEAVHRVAAFVETAAQVRVG